MIDERRFTPVITDFTRQTQPIVRYKLDDVLVVSDKPCPCGTLRGRLAILKGVGMTSYCFLTRKAYCR